MKTEEVIETLKSNDNVWNRLFNSNSSDDYITDKIAVNALVIENPEDISSGCYICNDTSNARYYENKDYKYCPHCGYELN